MTAPARGKLIVLSGPSGAGKSTVLRRLLEQSSLPLVLSVSATTRPPRQGEVDGTDYHFLTAEEFAERRRRGVAAAGSAGATRVGHSPGGTARGGGRRSSRRTAR